MALRDLSAVRIVQRCHFEKTSVLPISSLQGEESLPQRRDIKSQLKIPGQHSGLGQCPVAYRTNYCELCRV